MTERRKPGQGELFEKEFAAMKEAFPYKSDADNARLAIINELYGCPLVGQSRIGLGSPVVRVQKSPRALIPKEQRGYLQELVRRKKQEDPGKSYRQLAKEVQEESRIPMNKSKIYKLLRVS